MLFDSGKLEKMTIRAFLPQGSPDEPPQLSEDPEDSYVVQVNPDSYSLSHTLRYSDRQGQGQSGSEAVYAGSEPRTLTFKFLFDGTGAVPPPSDLGDVPLVGAIASALSEKADYDVMEEIRKFSRVVHDYEGEIHRPRKVLLAWGELEIACALESLTYQFTLFKPDGSPLRAVADCTLREALSDAERELRENNSSPDLTHVRELRDGDSLPLLAHQIYGKASLYLEVARVNKLVNFRRIRAGTRIQLPPVEKGATR